MTKAKKELREEFEKKWCKTEGSGLLSPFCHIDDVNGLLDQALQQQREEIGKALRKIIKERIAYGKEYRLKNKDSLRNGWSSIESGPCCDKCRMDKKAVAKSGRAVALRLMVGCTNPFQSKKICECHLPFRKVAEESIQKELKNILFNLDTYLKQND